MDDDFDMEPVVSKKRPKKKKGGALKVGLMVLLVMLALIAGGAWASWYFWLSEWYGSGDAGEVPVVRADSAPVKSKPKNPGGMAVPHRDKLVYDRMNGDGSATQGAEQGMERLLPPPETPMPPPQPMAAPAPMVPATGMVAPAMPMTPPAAPMTNAAQMAHAAPPPPPLPGAKPAVKPDPAPMQPAPAPQPAPKVVAQPAAPVAAPAPAPAPTPTPTPAPVAKPAVPSGSPTPLQPQTLQSKTEMAKTVAAPKPKNVTKSQPKPAAIQAKKRVVKSAMGKSYKVQLGAVRKRAAAEVEWKRLKRTHKDVLGKMALSIVRADLGAKGVYYRLRAGPIRSKNDAAALCVILKQRKVPCFPVAPGK